MKMLKLITVFLVLFTLSSFIKSNPNEKSSGPVPEDKIFWNLDGSYHIVRDGHDCVQHYTERIDGSGYDFEWEGC